MDKVKILIIEDEFIIAEDTRESLTGLGYEVSGIAGSYDEAVELLANALPDIALIDIQLKGAKTGIDLGHYIRNSMNMPFIYLSSYSDQKTVNEAKATQPDAYLVKPFNEKELYTSIEIAVNNYSNRNTASAIQEEKETALIKDSIFIKKDYYYTKVKLSDVLFVRSDGNYLEIIINDSKKHLIRSTFNDFMACLPSDKFQRTHKSYVVNIDYITGFSSNVVYVQEHEIPISKSRKDDLIRQMNLFT